MSDEGASLLTIFLIIISCMVVSAVRENPIVISRIQYSNKTILNQTIVLCKIMWKWLEKPTPTVQEGAIRQTIVATIPTTTNRFQDHNTYSPPPTVSREFIVQAPLNHRDDNDGLPTYEQVIKMNH